MGRNDINIMASNPFMVRNRPTDTTGGAIYEHSGDNTPTYISKNIPSDLGHPVTRPSLVEENGEMAINYSPKHSRRPGGSGMSRNINAKNLSLKLFNENSMLQEGEKHETSLKNGLNRRKTPSIMIPHNSTTDDLLTPLVTKTPLVPPSLHEFSSSDTNMRASPRARHFSQPQFTHFRPYSENTLSSPFLSGSIVHEFSQISMSHERDSKSQSEMAFDRSYSEAYPSGPANVLNDTLYLFSDPESSSVRVDINKFDLVINVAKECRDLSESFRPVQGKEYVYLPWSHTSTILKELPRITKKIQEYDDSLKSGPKRKILVHCQCGVSRSACVIVAYFMAKFNIELNEAYELLKSGTNNELQSTNCLIRNMGYRIDACDRICPNMSLIFELMDFRESMKAVGG